MDRPANGRRVPADLVFVGEAKEPLTDYPVGEMFQNRPSLQRSNFPVRNYSKISPASIRRVVAIKRLDV